MAEEPQEINVQIPPELETGVYANFAIVHSSEHEITIDLGQMMPRPNEGTPPTVRVVSPDGAGSLAVAATCARADRDARRGTPDAYVGRRRRARVARFRVKTGKTAAARRWVALPEWLMQELSETCPREDRTSERRVFAGFSPDVAKNVMARACKTAGIVHRHPHDLRHRYASVKIADGVPVTQVAAQLGHSRKSLTLDTYSHVLVGAEAAN
jgi:hypothetical protein